jgi:hypothetical protein
MADQFSDLCEFYALGILDGEERISFERHLAEGCKECRAGITQALELNEMILSATPRVEPSPSLRRRVLAGFGQPAKEKRGALRWTFVLAAAAALILAFAVAWNGERKARLAGASELARLREIQQILQAPETKQVTFGPQPAAPHGNIFIHDKLGMILIASGLPEPPPGWIYESWVVPKEGAPRPIEAFRAIGGRGISLMEPPLHVADLKAVAVSMEPINVPVSKPTKLVFAAPLGS